MQNNMMTDPRYKFSEHWFLNTIDKWNEIVLPMKNNELNVLEIGSFEGMSAAWFCDNVFLNEKSRITCIDPFSGSVEHDNNQKENLYERFKKNVIDNFPDKVTVMKKMSNEALLELGMENNRYDIIYIDGDHNAKAVYQDAVLAWPLLKRDGLLIFDDYLWEYGTEMERPKPGIDAFLKIIPTESYEILHKGYQIFIKKI